jgi:hypothetical protein
MSTTSKPKFEHVQTKRLACVALILSSVAAIPALLLSPLVIVILLRAMVERDNLVFAFGIASMMVVGWWLYWTYWQELDGHNHQGKLSWLVSALFNGALAIYTLTTLYHMDSLSLGEGMRYGVILLWVSSMTVISIWVWVFQLRK